MRILHVNHLLPVPPMDGGRLRKLQHLAALSQVHEITVLGRCADPEALAAFTAAHPAWRVWHVAEPADPARNPIPRAVREAMAANGCDVLHVSGFAQWPGARSLGDARVVLDIDSLDGVVLQRMRDAGGDVSPFAVAATDALTRTACEQADLVLACSDVDAAHVRRAAPAARVEVAENGIDVGAYANLGPPPAGPPIVTFTGFLAYWPNADACAYFADEILPVLQAARGDIRFRMVGRVPPADVVALASRPGVELASDVPDMRPYLRDAQVLVAPLRAGSGTRLKILEAFAAGRPVVSTSVGCEGLPVVSGEHLLIADAPHSFAEAVLRVLADPRLAARLVAAASALVRRRFDYAALASRLLDTYARLEARPRRPPSAGGAP